MNGELYCSTGAMVGWRNGFNYIQAFKALKTLQDEKLIDGVELMMLNFYYDKMSLVLNEIKANGLKIKVVHCEKDIGTFVSNCALSNANNEDYSKVEENLIEKFKLNCKMAKDLAVNRMVLHLWGGYDSDKIVEFNINYLSKLQGIAKTYDVKLLIENVPCSTNDPLSNWKQISSKYPDITYIFDTRFGQFHNQISNIWNSDLATKIEHIHISDFVGFENGVSRDFTKLRPIPHPGDGTIDFEAFFANIKAKSYKNTFTIESPIMNDDSTLNLDKMKQTLKYVRNKIGELL